MFDSNRLLKSFGNIIMVKVKLSYVMDRAFVYFWNSQVIQFLQFEVHEN